MEQERGVWSSLNFCHTAPTTVARKEMAKLMDHESWLVIDLHLMGHWLLAPASTWHDMPELRVLEEFAQHQLVVVNNLCERGVHLATDFINMFMKSEEQRPSLFWVVEDFR